MAVQLTTSYQLIKTGSGQQFGYAYGYLELYAKYNSRDLINNKTNVSYRLNLVVSGGYIGDYNGNKPVVITGTNGSQTTYIGNANYYSQELATYTEDIPHNNDGTKSGTASASVNFTGWQQTLTTGTANFDLLPIPRASVLNSATMSITSNGSTITVTPNITKNVNSYYDTLYIKDGNTEIATLGGVTSGNGAPLDATAISKVYNAIGTNSSKTFTAYLKTKTSSSGTDVGTSASINITATLPTYSLTYSTSSITETVTTYNQYKGSGNENTKYIANLSKPKYEFVATSSSGSTYGRSISYKAGTTAITSPYTDNNFTGTILSIVASDGRKSVTYTPNPTVVPYFKPTLTTTVTRPTPTGNTVKVQISGAYYDGDKLTNLASASATLTYTESGGSQQSTTISLTASTSNHRTTFSGEVELNNMNYQKSVQWSVVLSDRIRVTTTNSGTLPQGLPVWNAYKDSNGNNYFNVNGETSIKNSIKFDSNNSHIYWKEIGYGDQFQIVPEFNGADDNNKLKIQSAVGGSGTTPSLTDSLTLSGKSGNLWIKGNLTIGNFARNTTDTWIPVINNGVLDYTKRKIVSSKTHTDYNNDQDFLPTMSFLSFWNGAYNSGGSSNLTYGHEGTIQCKPKSLYDNSTGTTGTVTLSETSANFNYLEVFYYKNSDKQQTSQRIYAPNGKNAMLVGSWYGRDTTSQPYANYFYREKIAISGTSITRSEAGASYVSTSAGVGAWQPTAMNIIKVLGWK